MKTNTNKVHWNKLSRYWLTLGTLKRNSHIYWRMPCLDWVIVFQKKIQTGSRLGLEDIFVEKTPGIFRFVTLPLGISEKKRVHPRKLCKIVVHSFFGLEISRLKTKTHGNSAWFFLDQLVTPRNSTSCLTDPWNFLMVVLQYTCKLHVLNPLSSLPPTPCFWIFLE